MTGAERSARFKAAHPERVAAFSAKYYAAHPERVKAATDAWRAAHPEKVRAQQRAYLETHREQSRAKGRRWDAAHRAEASARHARYAAANRQRLAEIEARRRARRQGNGVFTITDRAWRRVLHRYRNACAYCGAREPLDMEHVIPISRGGRHAIGNLVPACDSCNGSKADKLLVEWRYRNL